MRLLSLKNERAYSQVCVTQEKGKLLRLYIISEEHASYFCQRTSIHLGLTTYAEEKKLLPRDEGTNGKMSL